jgi:hypothetical protein
MRPCQSGKPIGEPQARGATAGRPAPGGKPSPRRSWKPIQGATPSCPASKGGMMQLLLRQPSPYQSRKPIRKAQARVASVGRPSSKPKPKPKQPLHPRLRPCRSHQAETGAANRAYSGRLGDTRHGSEAPGAGTNDACCAWRRRDMAFMLFNGGVFDSHIRGRGVWSP